MPANPFLARRRRLLTTLGDGIAVIATAPEAVRNRDTHHPYRFDSYFWYLTGFSEPEAVLALVGGKRPKSILFCRPKHEEREIWDGFRYGPRAAKAAFGFDAAYPIAQFDRKFAGLLADRPALWHTFGGDAAWDKRLTAALNTVRGQARAGKRAPRLIRDLRAELDAMRLVKDDAEAANQQRAADITSAAHARAMRFCRPGMAEYQLEAELIHEFRRHGGVHAYPPIVAGGVNACVLHYVANDKPLADGSLVLIDAGCEIEGYAADITRTFPVSGRFSAAQKDVYEIVLAAQAAALAAIAPGRGFAEAHQAAVRVLTAGLVDLKLLAGDVDNLIEKGAYSRFYMHRTGHWLGLDVHDAGDYKSGGAWTTLQPGMTLTVEPGLYIRPAADVPTALAGIGIRIEDDARVTADGCAVYTSAPKTVAEIEETMRHD
ncbi:MAG: aminopeptidase P N-terminal domain-containing protein [Azonexus sp.]|jgi:Xaa-Pro aminopeptidase|nr:aminopeptidase P N-terminal domain-containing protein [Azonexus sp.]